MFQLKTTPFHERTSKLCLPQNWRRWAGYLVVGSYELTLDREYWAIRNAAALIDVTPLMKYIIKGKDASRLLNRVVTRDMDKLKVGQVYYTGWCDEEGKMIDDGTISRLDETTFRMTSADPSLRWLSMNAVGLDVEITEVTDDVAALSFQGPNSRKILNKVADDPVDGLKYFRLMKNQDVTAFLSRFREQAIQAIWVLRSGWMQKMRSRSGMRSWMRARIMALRLLASLPWTWRAWKRGCS